MSGGIEASISLLRLFHHVSPGRKRQLAAIFVLTLISTISELVSVGALLPFLGLLTTPDQVFNHPLVLPVVTAIGFTEPRQLLLPITGLFISAAILSGVMRLVLLWAQTRLGSAIGLDLAFEAYRRTLYQPYIVHASRNSSEVASVLVSKVHIVVNNIVVPVIAIFSAAILVLAVVTFMLLVEPGITLVSMLTLAGAYLLVAKISFNHLDEYGRRVTRSLTAVSRLITEGLGAIRDVILGNAQKAVLAEFAREESRLRRSYANIAIIGAMPRHIIETLAIVLFAWLAHSISTRPDGMAAAIPVLGAIALAVQRILPMAQQIYSAWTTITSGLPSLRDVLSLLDQPLVDHAGTSQPAILPFKHEVTVRDLRFRYDSRDAWILNGVNLRIPRGSRVGFIGTTGSGKSTLLDVLMGLLVPTSGSLLVDGLEVNEANRVAWQARIAHVPQSIFLLDASVAANIAFSVAADHIDHDRVHMAAQRAQIGKTIESWPEGYDTVVGERGIRLSGGQRQRIGIARALYKQAEILVFDEATSALDAETEAALVDAVNGLDGDLTMLVVSHKVSTIRTCTLVVQLANGQIDKCGSYDEVVLNSKLDRVSQ